jgi:hypothetical protein
MNGEINAKRDITYIQLLQDGFDDLWFQGIPMLTGAVVWWVISGCTKFEFLQGIIDDVWLAIRTKMRQD